VSPPSLLSPRTAAKIARAIARCLAVTERSAQAYARAARRLATTDAGTWLARVAAERESFVQILRDQLAQLSAVLAASEAPELGLSVPPSSRGGPPSTAAGEPAEVLATCDATDRDVQRVYEICRSELSRGDVPREIRSRIDAQYAAVCNARFDLHRRTPPALAG